MAGYVKGVITVTFKNDATEDEAKTLMASYGFEYVTVSWEDNMKIFHVIVPEGDEELRIKSFKQSRIVKWAIREMMTKVDTDEN